MVANNFFFYPAERFDIMGKQVLKTNQKWYIVYLELLRRGYQVHVGKVGTTEVDFVTQRDGKLTYFQVTADLTNEETFDREIRPMEAIGDNYPKFILTLDHYTAGDYNGIQVLHVLDWLC